MPLMTYPMTIELVNFINAAIPLEAQRFHLSFLKISYHLNWLENILKNHLCPAGKFVLILKCTHVHQIYKVIYKKAIKKQENPISGMVKSGFKNLCDDKDAQKVCWKDGA